MKKGVKFAKSFHFKTKTKIIKTNFSSSLYEKESDCFKFRGEFDYPK